MKSLKLILPLTLLLLLSSSKCGYDPLTAFDEDSSTDNSSTTPKSCTSAYTGPSTTTYPQSAPICYQAWYYRSQGLDENASQVKTLCAIYDQWLKNDPKLMRCIYCNPSCK